MGREKFSLNWYWDLTLPALSHSVLEPITFLLVGDETRRPFKSPEEDEEGIQEGTVRLTAGKEIRVDAATVAALSQLDGNFHIKRRKLSLKDFYCGHAFT